MSLILPSSLSADTLTALLTFTIDAATDSMAFSFVAQNTTPIAKVQVHISTKTGTPNDLLVLLAADTDGRPTGTPGAQPTDIGGGSPTLVAVANGATATGVNTFTFTNAYTPTAGTRYWLVLWPGGSGGSGWSASHRYIFAEGTGNFTLGRGERVSTTTDTATTWTALETMAIFSFSLQDASNNYLPLLQSAVFASTTLNVTPSSGSSPNEYGTLITIPTGQAVNLYGMEWMYRIANAATSDSQLDAWTNPLVTPVSLESFVVDVSAFYPVTSAMRPFIHRWVSGPYALTGGTVLGVSNRATGAGTVTTAQVIFQSQAAKEAALFLRDWQGMDRAGGSGAFTARPDRIYSLLPRLSLEDVSGSSGGGLRLAGHGGLAA